jgi:hypothetical protein
VKTSQLQIRLTGTQKSAIQSAANHAGMDMSAYVLSRALPPASARFCEFVTDCANEAAARYALAELNSFLAGLTPREFADAVGSFPRLSLTPFVGNYVAAMVEYGCARAGVALPAWTREIAPLIEPFFGTELRSLRLHLLTRAPPPFRYRNIFIDASLGQRI